MALHFGDCLQVLPTLPPGEVDLLIADLPYGVTRNSWDRCIDMATLWPLLRAACKPNAAMVFFATQPFASRLIMSNLKEFRYDLILDKGRITGFLNAKKMPLRRHETIAVFYRKMPCYNPQMTPGAPYTKPPTKRYTPNYGKFAYHRMSLSSPGPRYPVSVLAFPTAYTKGMHPTQKPLALIEWLIATYTQPGQTVLDPTMGSGTTGVACKALGRQFVGIERDATYYTDAARRIRLAKIPA